MSEQKTLTKEEFNYILKSKKTSSQLPSKVVSGLMNITLNPGSLRVLTDIYDASEFTKERLEFISQHLMHYKIWVLYKDVCKENYDDMYKTLDELIKNNKLEKKINGKKYIVMNYLNNLV